MAISINTPASENFGWIINATSEDVSECEELVAAPPAGSSIIIDYLVINSAAAITVTIGQGETAGAVTTALIGPISFAANQTLQLDLRNFRNGGLALTAATSLTVDASGAGNICIFACGRIE